MEAFATYLIKSSVWLTGFALVYALFLRNERFFTLNRIYLVSGILFSMIFPLFTWHYTVLIPIVPSVEVSEPQIQGIVTTEESFNPQNLLLLAYLAGILYLSYRILRQTLPVFSIIRKSETQLYSSAKLIRTDAYPASFSFFSFVFVNPSIDEIETNEIVNHELEHIRQQHWIDLLLFEILRTMQWFNPAIWLYGHLIRQNHEYLADERALQRSANPAIYRAALLNQMFGGPVISLANSFNYSLNKKRFNMMKQTISSPIRKLKLLIVLPLIAGVFYAFAAPEYKYIQGNNNTKLQQVIPEEKTVKGKVISEDGKPLKGATVIVSGSSNGTVCDVNGNFKLIMTDDSPISISYVGFGSQKVTPDFEKEMVVTMKTAVITALDMNSDPPSVNFIQLDNTKKESASKLPENVLVIIDGKESSQAEMNKINPEKIESIDVLKNESATILYGEKGKNGVVLITMKKNPSNGEKGSVMNLSGNFVAIDSNDKTPTSSGLVYTAKNIQGVVKNESFVLKADSIDADFGKTNSLLIIDGKESTKAEVDLLNPDKIESVSVLKNESAVKKYGEKGKNGVVEITLKSKSSFTVVEEMPSFPGGTDALTAFINTNLKYPSIALENGFRGRVIVGFVVGKNGAVYNVKVTRGVDPALDKEAMRIVKSMPNWNPGKQNGQTVEVAFELPIDFKIPADYHPISNEKLRTNNLSKIGNISWVNNTVYSSAELNKVLRIQKGDQYSKDLINRRIWTDLDGVSSIYLDKGYAFSNIETSENPTNDGTINLTFTIYEGKRAKIGKIDIKGNKSVSTEEILSKIVIKPGDLFSKTKIIQSVEAISKMGKFDSEAIKPAIIPNSQNFSSEFGTIDLVFNVTEK